MDRETLEILTQEKAPQTRDLSLLEKEKKSASVITGYSLVGSRVHLYSLSKGGFNSIYAATFIAPSDYGLTSKRIEHLDSSLRDTQQLALSPILKDKTLDQANADFLSLLLPPYPLRTQDLLNNKPRIIYHLFSEERTGLLKVIIRGLR